MTANDKHPNSGVVSVIMSGIASIMLMISFPLAIHQTSLSIFLNYIVLILLSILFAIIGIISGLIGLKHQNKMFPVIGLVLGGSFFAMLFVIITTL